MLKKKIEFYDERAEEIDSSFLSADHTIDKDIQGMLEALQFQMEKIGGVTAGDDKFTPVIKALSALKTATVDTESRKVIDGVIADTYAKVETSVLDYIGIDKESNSFNLIRDLYATEYQDFVSALYEFFIMNRLDNLANYLFNKIIDNARDYTQEYKDTVDKKDFVTKLEKKHLKSPLAYVILDRLDNIIHDALVDESEEDFLALLVKNNEDEWCNAKISEAFDSVFIPRLKKAYFGNILDESGKESLKIITLDLYRRFMDYYKPQQPQE